MATYIPRMKSTVFYLLNYDVIYFRYYKGGVIIAFIY